MFDSGVISSLLLALAGLVGWAYTQTQARSKSQRAELRHRRLLGLEAGRYCYDLEQAMMSHGLDLPAKRAELVAAENEDW